MADREIELSTALRNLGKKLREMLEEDLYDVHEAADVNDIISDEIIERVTGLGRTIVQGYVCGVVGHIFADDHCGKPEHRYCVQCTQLEQKVTNG